MFVIRWNNSKAALYTMLVAVSLATATTASAEDKGGDTSEIAPTKELKKGGGGDADKAAAKASPKDASIEEDAETSVPEITDNNDETEDAAAKAGDSAGDKGDSDKGEANAVEEMEDVEVEEVEETGESGDDNGIFPDEFDGESALRRDRGVNILTARAVRPMSLLLVVDHRAYKNLFSGEDAFFDYLGLDYGQLKLGLGLRFGIIDGLDAGIYRLNDGGTVSHDTYELDVRYAFLRQERFHVDVSVRAGISWFAEEDATDAVGGFGQIFVDRVFFDMLLVGAGFQLHSNSTNQWKSSDAADMSAAVEGVIEWRFLPILALDFELAYAVVGYKSKYPDMTFALKFITYRHTFSLMLSNTQFINADGIVSNTERDMSELVFGFQIVREFNFGKGK